MRSFIFTIGLSFMFIVSACGSDDSPRYLNIDEEPETENTLEDTEDKGMENEVDTEIIEVPTDDEEPPSSDLAVSGMWQCIICDPSDE